MTEKTARGAEGEKRALLHLQKKGYELLERNYSAQRCEIDLVMQHGETTVFVEVKARSSTLFGLGREAVTGKKQQNLIKAATVYAADHGLLEASLRFDVVEVALPSGKVTHIENAFPA